VQKARNQIALDLKQSIAKVVVMGNPRLYPTWEKFLMALPSPVDNISTRVEGEETPHIDQQNGEVQVVANVEAETYIQIHVLVIPTGEVRVISAHDLLLVGIGEEAAASYPINSSIPFTLLQEASVAIGLVFSLSRHSIVQFSLMFRNVTREG
jgi:hypothetical protein